MEGSKVQLVSERADAYLLTVLSLFLFSRRNFFVRMMFLSRNVDKLFLFCRFQFSAMTAIVLVKHFFTYLATNASIVIHTTHAWLVLGKIPNDMGHGRYMLSLIKVAKICLVLLPFWFVSSRRSVLLYKEIWDSHWIRPLHFCCCILKTFRTADGFVVREDRKKDSKILSL